MFTGKAREWEWRSPGSRIQAGIGTPGISRAVGRDGGAWVEAPAETGSRWLVCGWTVTEGCAQFRRLLHQNMGKLELIRFHESCLGQCDAQGANDDASASENRRRQPHCASYPLPF